MPTGSKYYPTIRGTDLKGLTLSVALAFRQAFDFLFTLRDDLGPLVLTATRPTQDVTITTTPIVGIVNLTLPRTGLWLIQGVIHVKVTGDGGETFRMQLVAGVNAGTAAGAGVAPVLIVVPGEGVLVAADGTEVMIVQIWEVLADKVTNVQLFISKDAGAGTSVAVKGNTTLTATWAGRGGL